MPQEEIKKDVKGKSPVSEAQMTVPQPPDTWRRFLANTTISSLLPAKMELSFVNLDDTIAEAVNLLRDVRVLAAPIWDKKSNSFVGLIDMSDISFYIISQLDEKTLLSIKKGDDSSHASLASTTVEQCIGFGQCNPWCPVFLEKPLLSLMDMFGREVHMHRIPVVDADGKVVGVLAQSRVVEFLSKSIKAFDEIAKRTVQDCFSLERKVESISNKDIVLYAFKRLQEKSITGLAVVNAEGTLVGNVSATDMKAIAFEDITKTMLLPIEQFLDRTAEFFKHPMRGLYCQPEDSVHHVLQTLTQEGVHRLYIVNDAKQPLGIVSLTDIIECLDNLKY